MEGFIGALAVVIVAGVTLLGVFVALFVSYVVLQLFRVILTIAW